MTTYRRAEGAASAEVDGDVVVLSPSDLRYHSLNATAGAIWELLDTPRSLDGIVDALLEVFDVDHDTCRAEAESCLTHLAEVGVVTPGSTPPA